MDIKKLILLVLISKIPIDNCIITIQQVVPWTSLMQGLVSNTHRLARLINRIFYSQREIH